MERRSDEELFLQYKTLGRSAPLEKLFERHYPRAFRTAFGILGDEASAEDAAQEAFINLIRSAPRYEDGRPFAAWWMGIVVNCARKEARKRRNQARRDRRKAASQPTEAPDLKAENLMRQEIRAQVSDLPLDLREAIVLRYFEGHSHREVAAIIGCAEGTASSRIRRGLERLKPRLGPYAPMGSTGALALLLTSIGREAEARPAPDFRLLLERARGPTAAGIGGWAVVAGLGLLVISGLALSLGAENREDPEPRREARRSTPSPRRSAEALLDESSTVSESQAPKAEAKTRVTEAPRLSPAKKARAKPRVLRVTDSEGEPAAGAELALLDVTGALDQGAAPSPLSLDWNKQSVGRADESGRFALPAAALYPGQRLYLYARRGFQAAISPPLRGEALLQGAAPPLSLGSVLALRPGAAFLRIEIGGPVRGARLDRVVRNQIRQVLPAGQNPWIEGTALLIGDQPLGEHQYLLRLPGYAETSFKAHLKPRMLTVAKLVLEPASILRGAIQAPPGAAKLEIRARDLEDPHRTDHRASVSEDAYRFASLVPGRRYRLWGRALGLAGPALTITAPKAGENPGPALVFGLGARLSGRLVDDSGEPVPGKVIRFFSGPWRLDDDGWMARSDASGRFAILGLSPGLYQWRSGERWQGELLWERPADPNRGIKLGPDGGDMGDVPLGAPTPQRWTGQVIDWGGRPVPRAILSLSMEGKTREARADRDGRFDLRFTPRGRPLLVARSPKGRSRPRELSQESPGQPLVLTLAERAGAIRGQVKAPPAKLRAGIELSLVREGQLTSMRWLSADPEGRFAFRGLEPGAYRLRALAGLRRFVVADRAIDVDLDYRAATEKLAVSAAADAVRGAYRLRSASLSWDEAGALSAGVMTAEARSGAILIEGVPAGPARLRVRFWGRGGIRSFRRSLLVERGLTKLELTWPGGEPGAIEGQHPRLSRRVIAAWRADGFEARTRASASGRYLLDLLPPGRYAILALPQGEGEKAVEDLEGEALELAPGQRLSFVPAEAGR